MINTLFLALLGATLGLRHRVFILIPAGLILSIIGPSVWYAMGDLSWIKAAVGLAYLATLSLGYVMGSLLLRPRNQPFSLETQRSAGT